MVWIKKFFFRKKKVLSNHHYLLPDVTLVIPAYNELDVIDNKMQNTFELDYPKEKLRIIWITDGSTDGSEEYLNKNYIGKNGYNIQVLHQTERKGKSAAINRSLQFVNTEIVAFCDANTYLNKESILYIVKHFENEKVGVVAGEKRVLAIDNTAGEGESMYWKYESWLKKISSEFYTCIGAVGELIAFRKSLFEPLPEDTILDDFVLSMQIADKGYKIVYEPNAYAEEAPSDNEKEEMKRKIRIAAGAFQCMFRYWNWLNVFKHPLLSFQYFSHKLTRWLLVPLFLPLVFMMNCYLFFEYPEKSIYAQLLFAQLFFYSIVSIQHFAHLSSKWFRIPYYIIMMNAAVYNGFMRYIKRKQSAVWEKVKRSTI
ncbi:MAG: glycosyltransferase family 2 protein [Bacteroidia bacterium]|nr:glycosyltransferase family 2 protein [Bacteroidia bacterium]